MSSLTPIEHCNGGSVQYDQKRNKRHQNAKSEVKLFPLTDDMVIYVENSHEICKGATRSNK